MKKNILILTMLVFSVSVWAQESMLTFSGGYAFAKAEQTDRDATGYRINGLYEFNPQQGAVAHGLSLGYAHVTSSDESNDVTINTWPVYYAPKLMFGKSDKFKVFLKGAIGMHFSWLKVERTAGTLTANDMGIYGGIGAGGMLNVNEKIFLNLEYEWAYMSNGYYNNGFLNTAQLGIGFKF